MLQQTQVDTVIDYYMRFLARFPTIEALANAEQDDVLHLWTGLGYYARARNLHRCAKQIIDDYGGEFPSTLDELEGLAGIGPSTAAAIASIAFGKPTAILDGNVKRVLTRFFAIKGWPGKKPIEQQLWLHARELMPSTRCRDYTQAIMDLGATLCTRSKPNCHQCPVAAQCKAFEQGTPTEYPTKKPKKVIPVKTTCMLLIQNNQGEILLKKRPAEGIWGGLYSLPEHPDKEYAATYCVNTLGYTGELHGFAALRHTFSHYHLDIQAFIITLDALAVMQSADTLWYNLNMPQSVGLAAPVKKLLNSVPNTTPSTSLQMSLT